MSKDMSLLVCGDPTTVNDGSEFGDIMSHIQESIDSVMAKLTWLSTQDATYISTFGPLLGRALLELSTTALIGRLDPLRLLFVRQVQSQPTYDTGTRWKSSLQWQGDVLAEKPKPDMWSAQTSYEDAPKALLGAYYDHLLWRPAFQRMSGLPMTGAVWLAELRATNADAFINRKRATLSKLYSELSKGVHHEFVMPPGTLYDKPTIVDMVARAVHELADVSYVSQFITHCQYGLDADAATSALTRLENLEVMK